MPGDDVYELYIDALTPATISMSRLAEYMRDFAEMLGHNEHVHFEKLKAGSLYPGNARRSGGAEQSLAPRR